MAEMKLITALASLLSQVGGWHMVTALLFCFVAPTAVLIYTLRALVGAMVALREEVRDGLAQHSTDYDNNVELVKNYEKLAGELTTMVRVNTSTNTRLSDLIEYFLKGGK